MRQMDLMALNMIELRWVSRSCSSKLCWNHTFSLQKPQKLSHPARTQAYRNVSGALTSCLLLLLLQQLLLLLMLQLLAWLLLLMRLLLMRLRLLAVRLLQLGGLFCLSSSLRRHRRRNDRVVYLRRVRDHMATWPLGLPTISFQGGQVAQQPRLMKMLHAQRAQYQYP